MRTVVADSDRNTWRKFYRAGWNCKEIATITGHKHITVYASLKRDGELSRLPFQRKRLSSIDDELKPYFVRGVVDGDGSISKNVERPSLSVCGGSGEFVAWCREVVYTMAPGACRGNLHLSKNRVWSMTFGGRLQVPSILKWLYAGSTPETRLARKYERAVAIWEWCTAKAA